MFIRFVLETGKTSEYLYKTIIYYINSLIVSVDVAEGDLEGVAVIALVQLLLAFTLSCDTPPDYGLQFRQCFLLVWFVNISIRSQ